MECKLNWTHAWRSPIRQYCHLYRLIKIRFPYIFFLKRSMRLVNIDKEPQWGSIKNSKDRSLPDFWYRSALIFKSNGIRSMDLIWSLSNFDPIGLKVWNYNSRGSSSGQNQNVSQKIYAILKLNFEVMGISIRKMLVSPDSKMMYKSFGT